MIQRHIGRALARVTCSAESFLYVAACTVLVVVGAAAAPWCDEDPRRAE